ncbi:MAG: FecR family protein [Devosia marina]|uniref:FecR family protein n=1 Tax=Devosia marina TaxID=2683198 RepID=UPI0032EEB156
MRVIKTILVAAILSSVSMQALGQDWVADRLRGGVLQFEGVSWVTLDRADVVRDGGKVRTLGDGRVELVRGQERIALSPNSEVAIRDRAGQKMTSVIQTMGSVTFQAERRNVQHFSVQTPVLAAVVKGTQFTVTYRNGQARVDVREGVVQVQDNNHAMVADVTRGQTAAASQATPLDVSGPGSDRVVYLIEGEVVPAAAKAAVLRGELEPKDALEAVQSQAKGNGNAPPAHSNAGEHNPGSGSSKGNAGYNGNGPPEHSNAGGNGNGNGNSGGSNSSGNGSGPSENSNAGGNGKGNGKMDD